MAEFRMPALGADMEAGVLVAWRRKPGELLHRGDVIAEVETDKGIIEVEVFADGVLERYLVEAGQKVPVGTPLAVLSEDGDGHAAVPAAAAAPPPAAAPHPPLPSPPLTAAEHIDAPPSVRRLARELGVGPSEAMARAHRLTRADVEAASAAPPSAAARPRSSPAARKRAQELGVDLARIRGTGPEGAVVLADVERAAAAVSEPATAAPRDARAALRRAIGAAMTRSKREIPHYYLDTTIELSRALAWLERYNHEHGVRERILPGALLLKAVARAAKELPDFNCLWQGEAAQRMSDVNLGVAVALRGGGLVAPAIHRADTLELPLLMSKLSDLVARARAGTLRSSELSDGTLTVTSLGERGVD
ncbi:MAG TPA: 2-oxo acid dehydrogenase subunit E2, partial [Polyangiales bacterium]|nr:2-oxo acid dehydrogenase subunit E2 [Polyangiales bacterium]